MTRRDNPGAAPFVLWILTVVTAVTCMQEDSASDLGTETKGLSAEISGLENETKALAVEIRELNKAVTEFEKELHETLRDIQQLKEDM